MSRRRSVGFGLVDEMKCATILAKFVEGERPPQTRCPPPMNSAAAPNTEHQCQCCNRRTFCMAQIID
uniref:Uncharacterized protein n=1 Tax=Globodera rostochiensis TaxID=31243 RepID=A0A914HVA8_GLORO